MSYANGTQFYNLPQTVGTDKRDWFDTNSAFAAVDAALHAAVTGQATDAEAIASLQTDVAGNTSDITSLQGTTATHSSQIATLANGVQENAANITDVRNDVEDMITAYNEASATSTHAYSVGDYFIYNNVLYRVTGEIAIGDTIVPDTNCTTTNVTSEIKECIVDKQDSVDNTLTTTSKTIVGAINEVNSGLAQNIIHSEPFTETGVTINANGNATVTVNIPSAYSEHGTIMFGYIKNTGWGGIIPQSTIITNDFKDITFTLHNTTDTNRTVDISGVIWILNNQ